MSAEYKSPTIGRARFMYIIGFFWIYFAILAWFLGLGWLLGELSFDDSGIQVFMRRIAGLLVMIQITLGFWVWGKFHRLAVGKNCSFRVQVEQWERSRVYHMVSAFLWIGIPLLAGAQGLIGCYFIPWFVFAAVLSYYAREREHEGS